jgi:hypothetical protein
VVDTGGSRFVVSLGKVSWRLSLEIQTKSKRAGDVDQVVELLPTKWEALSMFGFSTVVLVVKWESGLD